MVDSTKHIRKTPVPNVTRLAGGTDPLPGEGSCLVGEEGRRKEIKEILVDTPVKSHDFTVSEDKFGRKLEKNDFGRLIPSCDYENIEKYFFALFDSMRASQEEAFPWLQEQLLNPDIRHIILEAPTGSGKSGMALACALASGDAFISTANRYLQDQYEKDFREHLTLMKGKANYKCKVFPFSGHSKFEWEKRYNCGNSPCRIGYRHLCNERGVCEVFDVLNEARKSQVTAFNMASALAYTNVKSLALALVDGEQPQNVLHQKVPFSPRRLFVIDEAHSTPDWVTNYFSLEVRKVDLERFDLPTREIEDHEDVLRYFDFVSKIRDQLTSKIKSLGTKEVNFGLEFFRDELVTKIEAFKEQLKTSGASNFVAVKDIGFSGPNRGKVLSVSLQPVEVSTISQNTLFNKAEKFLFMSATMLDTDTFCRVLGIPSSQVAIKRLPSTFPKENRPIVTSYNIGSINKSNLEDKLPKLVETTDKLLDKHVEEKGIIHGHTYRICNFIYDNLFSKRERIIFPKRASEQKEALKKHFSTKEPTILLSPSMAEGVDLKDDASRFQIVAKIPFAYLGDPVLKRRMELYPGYYEMLTALTLVQQYGRSIRSETDSAITYILDDAFKFFVNRNRHIFSPWFLEAIQ